MKKQTVTIAVALTAITAMAQFSIKWSTLDGGGGMASGGRFVLRGTIGQPDAANLDGGSFVVHGGFWVPLAVQVGGAPRLHIVSNGSTNVVVSWAPDVPGWVLQQTDNLHTNWLDCATGPTNPVSIPTTNAAMFYRLRQE